MSSTEREPVELRGNVPRNVIDVLDAISTRRRLSRTELVNEILAEWVHARLAEFAAVRRVVGDEALP